MTTKAQLEKALELAVKSIILPDKIGCYDFCKNVEQCRVRHSTEEQLKVCVKPIVAHFLSLAKAEGKRKI